MNLRLRSPISVWMIIGLLAWSIHSAAGQIQYPILVLGAYKNFGSYTGEILKAEGFNEFQLDSFTDKISLKYLRKFQVVILT